MIAEIEIDKAIMEVEAVHEGTLGTILVPAGTHDVAVNTPIAVIFAQGEDADMIKAGAGVPPARAEIPAEQMRAAQSGPPAAHVDAFTGQFELRDWKRARRIETSNKNRAGEVAAALVSCQAAVLSLAVGKRRGQLTPVNGDLRVGSKSFIYSAKRRASD